MAGDDPDYEDEGGEVMPGLKNSEAVLLESDHALAKELQASLNASMHSTRERVPASNRIRLKVCAPGGEIAGRVQSRQQASTEQRQETTTFTTENNNTTNDGGGDENVGEEEEEFMNTDDEEEAQRRAEEAKKLRNTPACMLTDDVLDGMGEEVEMVITHRVEEVVQGMGGEYNRVPLSGKGAWKHWVFYVKWARYSHVHNTWEGYETLRGFGGFKKVMNYCKRVDELQIRKLEMTVEEREEVEWRENMEEEVCCVGVFGGVFGGVDVGVKNQSSSHAGRWLAYSPVHLARSFASFSRSIRRWNACLTSVWMLKMLKVLTRTISAMMRMRRIISITIEVMRKSSSSSFWSSGGGCRTRMLRGRPRRICWRRGSTGRRMGRGEGMRIGRRTHG